MKPVIPVIPGTVLPQTTFGANQPEYEPLPAFAYGDAEGTVLSRWRLTWRERVRVLLTGDVYLYLLTFGHPIQPSMLVVEKPETPDSTGRAS